MKQFKEMKEFYIIGGVKHGVLTYFLFPILFVSGHVMINYTQTYLRQY